MLCNIFIYRKAFRKALRLLNPKWVIGKHIINVEFCSGLSLYTD